MKSFRADDAQAGVGVAQNQHGVGLQLDHQLIGLRDYVAHRFTEIRSDSLHINVRVIEPKILEENSVKVVIVVLTRVGEDSVKILSRLVYHR